MPKREAHGGRPSKGARDTMVTRLPADEGAAVRQLAVDLDWSYSDTLAALIRLGMQHREQLPIAFTSHAQEELPLNKAS
ncbi:hypothetical protein FRP1_30270 (plasmid) [Pseudonocardia sp. EC080625-04]|uniref:hypothetical protein n=1 Tax=Pseudonocardia sp. EC080625-04 TaxID=1096868 RepID=UPI0006CB6DA2|nr:hypothetical protein [Pseudonocardia sp. EC080625-04]ALE76999.1 hypothetical protein FRP1_30270 [Pseudonocardia sp. EC080625-04]